MEILQSLLPNKAPLDRLGLVLKKSLKKSIGSFYKSSAAAWITHFEVEFVARIIKTRIGANSSRKNISALNLLFPAPDKGNIGDRMMLLATLSANNKKFTLVSEKSGDLTVLQGQFDGPNFVEIPHLYHRIPGTRLRALFSLASIMRESTKVLVIGADLMDGKYNYAASIHRLQILHLANELGIESRVLGFSWGENNPNTLSEYMINYCENTNFMVRDPISYQRLLQLGVKNIHQVADLVFNYEFKVLDTRLATRKYCIINSSGLISQSSRNILLYGEIIRKILALGFEVILLPHVIRNSDDDLAVLRSLYNAFLNEKEVTLIENILQPEEILKLCLNAEIVITSRMHLAILSLISGTPPIVFSSNGKVEGLLKMFQIEQLCIPESNYSSSDVMAVLDSTLRDVSALRSKIKANIKNVSEMSSRNFVRN